MVHTQGDAGHAKYTQILVQEVIKEFRLSWDNDIENVMPARDLAEVLFKRRRQLIWNFRYALVTNAAELKVRISLRIGYQIFTKLVSRFYARQCKQHSQNIAF
jgi:hypothetical protein